MEDVKQTKPEAIVADQYPGCLLQMKLGIEREELDKSLEALHFKWIY